MELKKGRFARFPIILFIVALPLLIIYSFKTVLAAPPSASDDPDYSTTEDTTLVITATYGVLNNDHDAAGSEVVLVTAPLTGTGTVDLLASGAFTYTPPLNFNGVVTFSYHFTKTGQFYNVANVTVTVTAVNDAPLAGNNNAIALEDTAVSIPVLANDSDVDGGLVSSSVAVVSGPVSGTTSINLATGAITYTPTLNFNGNDSFVYRVFDNGTPTPTLPVTATVNVTVTAVNDPPVAVNDAGSTNEDAILNVSAPGVLNNDSDVDNDSLLVIGFDLTSNKGAVVNVNANGSYSYNPTSVAAFNALAIGESTADSFSYTISDGNGLTDTAVVNITVSGVNDPPMAVNDTATINEDNVLTVSALGVLAGDSDPDTNDTLTASGSMTSSLGAPVTINANGSYTYNPQNVTALQALNNGGSQPDTFTYTVSDGHGGTGDGMVTVTVTGLNDAPVIDTSGNMTLTNINEDNTNSGGTLVSNIISSATGDRIIDADTGAVEGFAIVGVTNINGTWEYFNGSNWIAFGAVSDFNAVLLDTSELIRFVPNANYNGSAGTISFRAWDRTAGASGQANVNVSANGGTTPYSTAVETATLTVQPVNDAPVLDNTGTMNLTTIGEDNTASPGDTVAAIIATAGGDRITDVDAGAQEGVAVTGVDTSHGTWQYSINGGASWSNLSVSPTSATLLGALSKIRFVPQANYSGSAGNVTFQAWDLTAGSVGNTGVNPSPGGGTTAFSTAIATATLTIYSINDAPFLDLNGGGSSNTSSSATFTEDGGAVIIVESDLSIADVDDTNLTSARAVLTNRPDGTAESLAVTVGGTGITAVYNPTTGILSLTGTTTKLNYQTVLRTLAYNNTAQNPNTTSRLVEVTVNDGTDNSNLALSVVSITPVNDNPVLVNNVTLPVNEGSSNTITLSRLQVTDLDDTPSEIVYTVISPPAHGDLLLSGTPLDTNDMFTQANINGSALDYSNYGGEFTADSFTFTVADGSGGSIGVTTFNISINADNDSPVLAINVGLTLNEGATSTITNSRLNVTDADNTAVELTYNLEIAPVYGDLLLNGAPLETNDTFTQADINSAKLAYAHDGGETTSDSFTFSVEDGEGGMVESTAFTITINPVNDAPVVDLNGASAGITFEADFTEDGGAVAIVANTLSISDPDSANLLTAMAALTNRPDGTAESLSVTTGGTNISASYNPATGVLLLSGVDSLNNYQTVLRSLKYNNAAQDPTVTDRIVNVTVHDGTAGSSVAASTVTIHAVNDPPTLLTNVGLTVDYGQTGVINDSLLQITDLDNSTSELVYTVKSLPVNGQLKLNGTALAVNGTFTQANVDSGLLAYTHNKTNTESDNFQFTAVDGDGGSISQKTFAIVINPQPVVYLPVILNNYVYSEPNDFACQAFDITFNTSYQFLPDDKEDWYRFSLSVVSNVTVQISSYAPADGQMIVYSSTNCGAITQIKQASDITPGNSLVLNGLAAGTYYVRVYTAVPPSNPTPYTLRVVKP